MRVLCVHGRIPEGQLRCGDATVDVRPSHPPIAAEVEGWDLLFLHSNERGVMDFIATVLQCCTPPAPPLLLFSTEVEQARYVVDTVKNNVLPGREPRISWCPWAQDERHIASLSWARLGSGWEQIALLPEPRRFWAGVLDNLGRPPLHHLKALIVLCRACEVRSSLIGAACTGELARDFARWLGGLDVQCLQAEWKELRELAAAVGADGVDGVEKVEAMIQGVQRLGSGGTVGMGGLGSRGSARPAPDVVQELADLAPGVAHALAETLGATRIGG
jgi:hypothetical protein